MIQRIQATIPIGVNPDRNYLSKTAKIYIREFKLECNSGVEHSLKFKATVYSYFRFTSP